MPLTVNNEALVIASRGAIFLADKNTPLPTGKLNDFAKLMAGVSVPSLSAWERLGNTSRENLPEFTLEAGDTTQKGSWDNESIRTVFGDKSLSYTLHPMQHDAATVAKILNGWTTEGDKSAVMGATDWSFECAVVIVINDGGMISGFYIPNNTAAPTGLPSLSLEDFSEFELTCTAHPADAAAIPAGPDGRAGFIEIFQPTKYTAE